MSKSYRCFECDNSIEESELEIYRERDTGLTIVQCPHCHSSDIEEQFKCAICGEWIHPLDTEVFEEFICKECFLDHRVDAIIEECQTGLHIDYLASFVLRVYKITREVTLKWSELQEFAKHIYYRSHNSGSIDSFLQDLQQEKFIKVYGNGICELLLANVLL